MTVEFDNDIYTIDFTDLVNGSFAIQPFTTNGPLSPTSVSLAPGAVTASTTLTLVGRGLPGWGESVIENMVHMLENFAGPVEPTYMIPGQMWFDNTTDTMNVRNQANDTWNPVLTVGTDLDFGGFKGINVADATNPTDAMNQQSSDARYVDIAGDVMTAAANLIFSGGGEVLGLPATPSATAAASKEYVDATFVDIAGDTMTGDLILNADPTLALGAATKDYVDTQILSVGDVRFVNTLGDAMTGFLTVLPPSTDAHAATKKYVDDSVGALGGDGVVFSGIFDPNTSGGLITLSRTAALPDVLISGINSHPHVSTVITYQADRGGRLENESPEQFSTYNQAFANARFDTAAQSISARNKRQFALGSAFTGTPPDNLALNFSYPTETNRLQVFIREISGPGNSRKLVADLRGSTRISLTSDSLSTGTSVFQSTPTGLSGGPFTFTIDVDGGGAAGVSIIDTDAQIYGSNLPGTVTSTGLVDAMNAEFVLGGIAAFAEFDAEESAIIIWSDTTGVASSVVIVDTGLFAALTPERTRLDFTGITGASLPTGGGTGAWFDVSSTTFTYRFWFSDGSTVAPAAGGNVLTPIAFTGAESDQAISDLVVIELIGADADFAGAANFATPIITVTLATPGAVPDAADGVVSTGASITVTQEGVTTAITSIPGLDGDYSEDGPALSTSTSFTMTSTGPSYPIGATDQFEIIRIK